MPRKILHLDLDAFFCAVEALENPKLRDKPFAVGGKAEHRGVVASCSYAARLYGIHSAMPMALALRKCPELIVIPSRHAIYSDYSQQVMQKLSISPLVEQISIDEAFIDISDLPQPLEDIAKDLQHQINNDLHLPISIGGAVNKLVAKIANDWGKSQKRSPSPPNAITIIHPGEEAQFLAPLPVQALMGIGPKTSEKLAGIGIRQIGELAQTSPKKLELLFGRFGPELQKRARGIDNRPVVNEHDVKSISNEMTFSRDQVNWHELERTLRRLSEKVGRRLRKQSLAGTTVQIKLRWHDFTTITRQKTLPSATNLDHEIFETACELFIANWPKGMPVRLVGVGVSSLGPPVRQLSLWDDSAQKEAHLLNAMDELRDRFGKDIIQRAANKRPKQDNKTD